MASKALAATLARQSGVRQALFAASRALSSTQVVGESGRGLVRATLSSDGRMVHLDLSPSIGKEGPKAISGLVVDAVNRAHDLLREETRRKVVAALPPGVDPAVVLRALP